MDNKLTSLAFGWECVLFAFTYSESNYKVTFHVTNGCEIKKHISQADTSSAALNFYQRPLVTTVHNLGDFTADES